MKFVKPLASTLLLGLVVFASTAQADVAVVKPGIGSPMVARPAGYKFQVTMLKGDITVIPPSQFGGSGYGSGSAISGFQCSNLVIIADSKAMKPKPPGYTDFWPPQPIWSRTDVASSNWASGKCQYSMVLPGGEEFRLHAGNTGGNFECHYIDIGLGNTPEYQTVPKNTVKTDDIKVTKLVCGIIN